jgi:hypothetical protein
VRADSDGDVSSSSEGNTVYWFYTSCLCQDAPGPHPKPSGQFDLKFGRRYLLIIHFVVGDYKLRGLRVVTSTCCSDNFDLGDSRSRHSK